MRYLLSILTVFLLISCGTESTPVYTLTTSVNGEGTVSPSSGEFEEGETVTLTSTPSEHWVFQNWSGDGSGSSNSITITMDSDKNVVGNFSERLYPLNITIDGEGTVDEVVVQSKSEYTVGSVIELTPNPSEGWEFVEWSGDVSSTEEVIEVSVDGEVNVTVTFERLDYPLTITIEGEGTVGERIVSQPKTTDYPFETVIELTPIPSDGWRFVEWGGDLSGNEEPIQITIDGEKSVTVTFKSTIYLSDNGITIMCPDGEVGDIGIVDGVEYEVVDNNLLRQRLEEGRGSFTRNVCVTKVTDMSFLFDGLNFNESIGDWDVSSVTDMNHMFYQSQFNQPIGDWNVSSVIRMDGMFRESQFNENIGEWDMSSVKTIESMFLRTKFNQSIGDWNVSSVTSMMGTFSNSYFNQPIGEWNVSNVTDIRDMFRESQFNQNIENWDVSSVIEMNYMFYMSNFNQPIKDWNTSNVMEMIGMFGESQFNQNISNWCVWRIGSEPFGFSTNSPLTDENKPVWGTCPD